MIFRRVLIFCIVVALLLGGAVVWRRISQLSDDALAVLAGASMVILPIFAFIATRFGIVIYHVFRQRNEERERQHQRAIEREQPQIVVVQTPQKEIRRW
jgi:membrane protein implicated in regulation of membrane protease activity